MAKPRVQVFLTVDTAAHSATLQSAIASRLAGRQVVELHSLQTHAGERQGENLLVLDVRLDSGLDRDDLRDWLRDQIDAHPTASRWILAARLLWHDCGLDEPEPTHLPAEHPESQAWRAARGCDRRSLGWHTKERR